MSRNLIAVAMLAGVIMTSPCMAKEGPKALPTDISVLPPQEGAMNLEQRGDQELETHLASFLRLGYDEVPWRTWAKEREDVLTNLIAPDYLKRTGNKAPEDASFDFALINLTGGDFNDVIVSSHLPGDCEANGCRVMIFKVDAKGEWSKVASFNALAVATRYRKDADAAEVVAVGDEIFPSSVLHWNGKTFVEK